MSTLQIAVQFIAAPKSELSIDSVSLVSNGAEKVSNGGFEMEPHIVNPPDWIGESVPAPGLVGLCAKTESGIYQIVEVDNAFGITFDSYVKGRGSVFVSVTTRVLAITKTYYLQVTKEGAEWVDATIVGPTPLLSVESESWTRGYTGGEIALPGGVPVSPPAGILPQSLSPEPSVDEPGVKATIAKAGLAVAGIARCGFYPRNTDTITEPAEDPPVFTGGTYAYKKDLEGLE